MDSRKRRVQARRLPGQVGLRGRNTLNSTQLPNFSFEPQVQPQKNSGRTFRVPSPTDSEEEELLRHEGGYLDSSLPTQLDAGTTRQLQAFEFFGPHLDRLSEIGDSSSLFSEKSPAPPQVQEKEAQCFLFDRPALSSQQQFSFDLPPPSVMVVEREPPKATPQKPPQPTFQAIQQPEFGKPSPLGNRAQPPNVFNIPKPHQPRPEHHRSVPPVGGSHLQQVKDIAHKVLDPLRSGQASQPISIHSSPDVVEIARPAAPPAWNNYIRPAPTYSSLNPSSGWSSVNNYQRPIVDLTKPQVPSYSDPALRDDHFGAPDPFLYVDAGKATENIKALLEGAFEDEDDKPRTRSRKRNVDAAVAGLTDRLNGLDVQAEQEKETPEGDEEEEDDGTVEGLKVQLLPHQVDGVAWMRDKETGVKKKSGVLPKGGILADDMGLGKTIQSIALLLTNPRPSLASTNSATDKKTLSANVGKSTLVVAPLALIKQWEAEIKNRVLDSHMLRVRVHHGPQRTKRFEDLKKYDVVITTYQILVSEHGSSSEREDGPQAGCFGIHWYRVILDEAHTIKNRNAKATKACYALRAEYRWCLTGTPMQNNLDELQSLIKFLRIKPYDDLSIWKDQITRPMSQGRGGVAMKRLQFYLKAFMKRRTKDILKQEGALNPGGKPNTSGSSNGFKITARKIESVLADFGPDERRFYDRLEQRTDKSLEQMMGGEKINYASALVLLLRLRQACNHPQLVGGSMAKDKDALTTGQALGSQTSRNSKVAEDDMDEMADLLGGLSVKTKQCDACQIELGKDEISAGSIRCTECEEDLAAQKGQRETDKRKKHRISAKDKAEESKPRPPRKRNVVLDDSDEEADGDWIVPEHQRHTATHGRAGGSDDENAEGGGESLASFDTDTEEDSRVKESSSSRHRAISVDATDESDDHSSQDSSTEDEDSEEEVSSDTEPSLASITTSTKIQHLLKILHRESATHKFIVFSQFTSMLDLIEPFLRRDNLVFTRYDGSMRNDLREASLERLRNNSKCRVLLCSLKCGSLGLNLTAASRVVILEPFWNPFGTYISGKCPILATAIKLRVISGKQKLFLPLPPQNLLCLDFTMKLC